MCVILHIVSGPVCMTLISMILQRWSKLLSKLLRTSTKFINDLRKFHGNEL